MAPTASDSTIGVYLHVPFCAHICPYCDFNTFAGQDALIPRYVDALRREIVGQTDIAENRTVSSIFFGGGTPSLLTADQIRLLLNACKDSFDVAADPEITLEANPNSVDQTYFEELRQAGINRLSLGVQTTSRKGLRVLGRQHEAAEAEAAFLAARRAGFDNLSLDLIFGWPGQSVESWRQDLEAVVTWGGDGPEHLSLYSLIVEPGTPMADAVARGILTVLDEDSTADLYEEAIRMMELAGYSHYEVANWAKPETRMSRHNAVYWRNGDYLGLGAGAHGTFAGRRTMNHLLPLTYIKAIEAGDDSASNVEHIDHRTAMGETMMLGLRLLQEGVTDDEFKRRHGISLDEQFGATITEFVNFGLLHRTTDRVTLTARGLMLANDVCSRFL